MDSWIGLIFGLILVAIFTNYLVTKKENKKFKKEILKLNDNISVLDHKAYNANQQVKNYQNFFRETIDNIMKESALMPSLVRWTEKLQKFEDEKIVNYLKTKKRPARKASEDVKFAKAKARAYKKEVELSRNRVELYEKLAPWLIEYTEISLEDILKGLKEEEKRNALDGDIEDPVSLYISKTEWNSLSETQRNQLALDRYCDPRRKTSLWQIGVEYERFVGYGFEQQGYTVEYHGALHGKEDLGIDLICEIENTILIVQCKRLSRKKGIPVRENVIAQIYGATQLYKMKQNITKNVIPVIMTSYELSKEAKEFAKYLDVVVRDNYEMTDYPRIKCNISRTTNERIYHLPMDQQYDNVIIGNVNGEFYATTVIEAEREGFRRAFRWSGNN